MKQTKSVKSPSLVTLQGNEPKQAATLSIPFDARLSAEKKTGSQANACPLGSH